MRITDIKANARLSVIELCLTSSEARELRNDLDTLLADRDTHHTHVSSDDYQTELTVWIDDDQ